MEKEMYLVLENGEVFKGKSFGADQEAAGEVVSPPGWPGIWKRLPIPAIAVRL